MSKITFLGVWMTPEKGETVSFVIDNENGKRIMVDCCANPIAALLRSNIDPMSITEIIITHTHGDHISGLPLFLFYRILYAPGILNKPIVPIEIIASKQALSEIRDYIKIPYSMLVDHPSIKYTECITNEAFKIGNLDLSFFIAKHVPITHGFVINLNNLSVAYSADTSISEEIIKRVAKSDYLIHDVVATQEYSFLNQAHTLCEEISPLLSKYEIKHFIPVHRLTIYTDDKLDEYICSLKIAYNGDVFIPIDGSVLHI